ncbi:tetratricopeptide repeat protein [Foetidibacter luteolus]|uniref:tetratricopeptide repeat protein n=1 Tax=Foetidibacter luteolus TaxID=2608880 RepID=UPI00129BB5FF|nr:hypothetical protein [Foetidibacter luteolus]
MRYILLLLLIYLSNLSKAQNSSLQTFESGICDCLQQKAVTTLKSQEYLNCVLKNMETHRELIRDMATKKYGDSAKFKSDQFMEWLQPKIALDLTRDCGNFYKLMEDLWEHETHKKTRPELLKELQMRKTMDRKFSGNYFWYRGEVYLQLGDYKNALIDADSSIRDKPKDGRGYSLKGRIKEKQGNYADALKFYQKANAVEPSPEYRIIIAIVQRKQQLKLGKN